MQVTLRPLRGNFLSRGGLQVLGRGNVTRILGLAPSPGGDIDIGALFADRVGDGGADTLETCALLLAVAAVLFLGSHAGGGLAEAGMDRGARGSREIGRAGGSGRGRVLSLPGDLAGGVGDEGVLGGSGTGRMGLGVELGVCVIADLGAGSVLNGC